MLLEMAILRGLLSNIDDDNDDASNVRKNAYLKINVFKKEGGHVPGVL